MLPDGSNYAVVLPDTEGISDTTALFTYLKHKWNLTGEVEIYTFTTQRIVVNISS